MANINSLNVSVAPGTQETLKKLKVVKAHFWLSMSFKFTSWEREDGNYP